jgi:hypothetical protein
MREFSGLDRRNALNSVRGCPKARAAVLHGFNKKQPTGAYNWREHVREKNDELLHDHNHDGIDRRGFLKRMAWLGTGVFCVVQGGVLKSYSLRHRALPI